MSEIRVEWNVLQGFTAKLFGHVGLSPEDAAIESEVLIWANLRGIDSHGVQRVAGYINMVESGHYNTQPAIQIERETPATLLIEADFAFGPVVTTYAMKQAIIKAREVGIGWVLIRNTTHQGAMAYYTQMAAKENMAGIASVCNPPNMAPPGARAAGVHNSPIAIAVPGNDGHLISLDMATSVAAFGKLEVAINREESIPMTWALDRHGKPTTDPHNAKLLSPAGGYKGYGLALIFECLSSLMVGNPLLTKTITGPGSRPGAQNSFIAAINIDAFTDPLEYRTHIDELTSAMKGLPKIEGIDELFVPGEPEERVLKERLKTGIPLPAATRQKLSEVAKRYEVKVPWEDR
tara:strand:- start:30018 stop:31064 length:1047 start_codon:yes stop_codon:yes gene_type:complete